MTNAMLASKPVWQQFVQCWLFWVEDLETNVVNNFEVKSVTLFQNSFTFLRAIHMLVNFLMVKH